LLIGLLCLTLYVLTIRGNWNVPTHIQIDKELFNNGQAFETSQERSRYAIILSLINDHTFAIDNYASMGTPDIGLIGGHYYSFFPPGASVLAIPLYLLGLKLGATQIFTFLISTIFAFLTILMIIKFAKALGMSWSKAIFAAIAFGFATNAWGYSVTLYAHLISAFLLLGGLYIATIKERHSIIDSVLFWLLYALAVYIDFPNLFIFLPVALVFTFTGVNFEKIKNKLSVSFKWKYLLTPIVFLALMGLYGYYNYVHFGSPTVLSNSIPRVKDLKTTIKEAAPENGRESVGALNTRNMLNGFQSFTTNIDRGIAIYSPVVLLSIFMLFGAYKKLGTKEKVGLVVVPATCLTLYTMFGDPYGGWAFGSRYMIAVLPELCILAGFALNHLHKNFAVKLIFTLVFLYSLGVSLLAPLTTNVIPPKVEAGSLGLIYDYRINIRMLNENKLNSFVFNNYANKYVGGWQYYWGIYGLVALVGTTLIWVNGKTEEDAKLN